MSRACLYFFEPFTWENTQGGTHIIRLNDAALHGSLAMRWGGFVSFPVKETVAKENF